MAVELDESRGDGVRRSGSVGHAIVEPILLSGKVVALHCPNGFLHGVVQV